MYLYIFSVKNLIFIKLLDDYFTKSRLNLKL